MQEPVEDDERMDEFYERVLTVLDDPSIPHREAAKQALELFDEYEVTDL